MPVIYIASLSLYYKLYLLLLQCTYYSSHLTNVVIMNLVSVGEVQCFNCENSINSLAATQQEKAYLICERCFQLQSNSISFLNLSLHYYHSKLASIHQIPTYQSHPLNQLDEQTLEQSELSEGEKLMEIQARLAAQEEASLTLQEQLLLVEQLERSKLKESIRLLSQLKQVNEEIEQKREVIGRLNWEAFAN